MARQTVEIFQNNSFGIVHDIDEKPNNINFQLHNHDDIYEIVLLLKGDCEFFVEGNSYKLQPHDIVFTRPFEFHHIKCLSEKIYDRIILYIKADYFNEHNCQKFLDIFQNRKLGTGNLISYSMTDHALNYCMNRIYDYCEKKAYDVANKLIYEFLYLINQYKNNLSSLCTRDERIRNIIIYINDNLSENINLDILSKKFFITKQYMCKLFKLNTGYTINQYINYKRILLVQKLHRNGQSLIQSSMNAGFNNYANFYKTYVKYTGKSPKEMD